MNDPNRILVTGASGFVGLHLLPALRKAFPKSRLIGASVDGFNAAAHEARPLDLLDADAIARCVDAVHPDCVIHLAARSAVATSFTDPRSTWRINVDGTLMLAQAIATKAPDALMLFVSSAEIYGLTFLRGEALDEDSSLAPANPYAASKAAADIALGEMGLRGLKVLRLRPVNHTGRGQSDTFVAPAFAEQIALIEAGLQEPVLRVGELDRWRDFLDVDDVCAAYVAAVARGRDIPSGTAINIASGQPKRIGDILAYLVERARVDLRIEIDGERLRPNDIPVAACDATRAGTLLDWRPQVPWRATLDEVLDDWRERVRTGAWAAQRARP